MRWLKSDRAKKTENQQVVTGLWFLFNIGWFVALSLIIPTAIGLWLDSPERLNSRPLCTLIGFVLGTIIAGFGLYRMLRQFVIE
jgi:NhaP-type Na+/H+ or K+/H+ antiporter